MEIAVNLWIRVHCFSLPVRHIVKGLRPYNILVLLYSKTMLPTLQNRFHGIVSDTHVEDLQANLSVLTVYSSTSLFDTKAAQADAASFVACSCLLVGRLMLLAISLCKKFIGFRSILKTPSKTLRGLIQPGILTCTESHQILEAYSWRVANCFLSSTMRSIKPLSLLLVAELLLSSKQVKLELYVTGKNWPLVCRDVSVTLNRRFFLLNPWLRNEVSTET